MTAGWFVYVYVLGFVWVLEEWVRRDEEGEGEVRKGWWVGSLKAMTWFSGRSFLYGKSIAKTIVVDSFHTWKVGFFETVDRSNEIVKFNNSEFSTFLSKVHLVHVYQ